MAQDKISIVKAVFRRPDIIVGSVLFIPYAFIMTIKAAGLAWMFTALIPFGGGLVGFFVFIGTIAFTLKSYEWSMKFDSSSREILLPVLNNGFRNATRMNAWQAGLVISSGLFLVGLLWNFVF